MVMAVFNPISYDGRVKRAMEALSSDFDITLLSPVTFDTQRNYAPKTEKPDSLRLINGWLLWEKWPTSFALVVFWLQLIGLVILKRPGIVYVHDYYLPLPGFVAARIVRARCIYDAHELIIPNDGRKTSFRNKTFYWLEKLVVSRFDLVLAANDERATLMRDYYTLNTKPVSILNVTKPTLGSVAIGLIEEKFPELLKSEDERLVVYMGDVSLTRGLSVFLEALQVLPPNIRMIIIGSGPDLKWLKERHQSYGRVSFLGQLPQLWVQDVLSFCDLGVLMYPMDGLNNYFCSPNKIFEYTQAGIPVITSAQPSLQTIVSRFEIGVAVGIDHGDIRPKDIGDAIMTVFKDYEWYISHLPSFVAQFNLQEEQKKLRDAVRGLV